MIFQSSSSPFTTRIPTGHESSTSGVFAVPRILNSASVSNGIAIDCSVSSNSNSYSIPMLCLSLSCFGPLCYIVEKKKKQRVSIRMVTIAKEGHPDSFLTYHTLDLN